MARFSRTSPPPQVKGGYGAFRPYVRKDFNQCCAYCCFHERYARGEEGFQLDHFRPKDDKLFPHLANDFYNLYYACYPCNHTKANHWPSETLLAKGIGFVDLCKDNFEQHYVLLQNGCLEPLTGSARYTIKWLNLNSEHLTKLRALLLNMKRPLDKEP